MLGASDSGNFQAVCRRRVVGWVVLAVLPASSSIRLDEAHVARASLFKAAEPPSRRFWPSGGGRGSHSEQLGLAKPPSGRHQAAAAAHGAAAASHHDDPDFR